tara:strand:+ start:424 stop:558 length:135 start_codon:yes stop_codon:yes gene_type:complete
MTAGHGLIFILAPINEHSAPFPIVLACPAFKEKIPTNFNHKKAQ